jgi:two-component system, NtrC family, nitrogen regulation sensor histidine kinase NtrY
MRHTNDQPRIDGTALTPEEQRRRRLRNFWTFLGVTCLLIALTGAELYVQGLHHVLPLANNIVIFAIVNLNIILLLALVLLVLRNLVKRSVPDPLRALGTGGEWPDHQEHQQLV